MYKFGKKFITAGQEDVRGYVKACLEQMGNDLELTMKFLERQLSDGSCLTPTVASQQVLDETFSFLSSTGQAREDFVFACYTDMAFDSEATVKWIKEMKQELLPTQAAKLTALSKKHSKGSEEDRVKLLMAFEWDVDR